MLRYGSELDLLFIRPAFCENKPPFLSCLPQQSTQSLIFSILFISISFVPRIRLSPSNSSFWHPIDNNTKQKPACTGTAVSVKMLHINDHLMLFRHIDCDQIVGIWRSKGRYFPCLSPVTTRASQRGSHIPLPRTLRQLTVLYIHSQLSFKRGPNRMPSSAQNLSVSIASVPSLSCGYTFTTLIIVSEVSSIPIVIKHC